VALTRISDGNEGVAQATSSRRLHKGLHTYRTLVIIQVGPKEKAPFSGAFAEPSDGLEPSTPSLPWNVSRNRWQPVAADSACFYGFEGQPIVTGCDLLQPRGSIKLHPRFCVEPLSSPSRLLKEKTREVD